LAATVWPYNAFVDSDEMVNSGKSVSMKYRLRPATELDRSLLFDLYYATMRNYIEETWGWDDTWQRDDFDKRFREHGAFIIETGSHNACALWLESRADSLYISNLQILPALLGRGIGTAVIEEVIRRAGALGLPVALVVLPVNTGAQRLYERLGFKVVAIGEPFIHMRYDPPTREAV
jgi:ribosomal protein S18 acetylase RimI-like enzyme